MYFGLLCNGTSNLAATWKDLEVNIDFARECLSGNNDIIKLFNLLVTMEENRRMKDNCTEVHLGSCKMPRYQYANYGTCIVKQVGFYRPIET